jgi:pseudouridine-5'-phosphate glycosidase
MVSYGHCAPQITYRCKMAPDFFPRASDVPAMFAILLEYAEEPANTLLIIVVFLTL